MSKLMQGDQYALPIAITQGETVITDANIDGLRVRFGRFEKRYPGELTYSTTELAWMFPLTQSETLCMAGQTPMQVEIIIGDSITRSNVMHVDAGYSIIKTKWEANDE